MKANNRLYLALLLMATLTGLMWHQSARGEGIPEPSLILYGTIRNTAENNRRMTSGGLTWSYRNEQNGQMITFAGTVTNVLDQFSYVLKVRCEQVISTSVSSNALNLSGTAVRFDRSQIFYDGIPVTFATAAQSVVLLSTRDRGRVERVDLLMAQECADWDENGLCDEWELAYLGYIGVDPNDDPDGDGQTTFAEYKSGTDPLDPTSVFQFVTFERLGPSSIRVGWQSADGRYYSLLRYPSVLSTNYTVVQSQIFATSQTMSWTDTEAPESNCFYRLLLEP